MYRVQDFAKLAGVTVRTLHHYDRVGLLKPSHRDPNGYRLYSHRDLGRLEQIVVLKYLGLSLKEIGGLLRDHKDLRDVLRRQCLVLRERQKQLERVILAIQTADHALERSAEPDWRLFGNIIQEIEMEQDWAKKYYSEEGQAKVEARKGMWSPELQADVTARWTKLFAEVEAALGEDPRGARGEELAAKWRGLVAEFTGGDLEIQQGLNRMYADQKNWPQPQQQRFAIKPEIQEWILRAMAK